MSRRDRKKKPARLRWDPLQRAVLETEVPYKDRPGERPPDRVYRNSLYSVFVRDAADNDGMHISFHRHDRAAVRDWRHFQAIKNEVAGPQRTAIEVFPPEGALIDTANEYHLWVLPEELAVVFPYVIRPVGGASLMTDDEVKAELGEDTRARQRDWQPGIPTGKGIE